MNGIWQGAIIAALCAAIASIAVAIIGRGTNREANAVALSKDLIKEVRDLKADAEARRKEDDKRDRRVGRLERVLDAAIDHIADWEFYHANGDEGEPPEQPRVVKEFRERIKSNETEESQ